MSRSAPAAPQPAGHVTRIKHQPSGEIPSVGPADALVQLELFFSPGAANSRLPFQLILDLWRNHPTRIHVVFRVLSRQGQFHLPSAALEAAAQGKFLEFMTAVNSRLRGTQPAQIRELADSVGLDLERLDAAWRDGRHHKAFEVNERRRARMRSRQIPDALFASRPASRPITVLGAGELELAYRDAYDRARDALDRGVPRAQLAAALDAEELANRPATSGTLGPTDGVEHNDVGGADLSVSLLSQPLDLSGLPSSLLPLGAPERSTPRGLPVVIACNPLSVLCYRQLQFANTVANVFEQQVRVVWAPMFDPRSREADDVARVSDAVLCADAAGSGWSALDILVAQTNRRRGSSRDAGRLIDELIAEADLDGPSLAACLATHAGASVQRMLELRRSGMTTSPTMVVGGRMYPGGVSDASMLQGLVEDELAAGWLGQVSGVGEPR